MSSRNIVEPHRTRDVRYILRTWLRAAGFTGLVNDDRDCCCHVSSLLTCCAPSDLCRAARHIPFDPQEFPVGPQEFRVGPFMGEVREVPPDAEPTE